MERRTFVGVIAGGLLAAPLAVEAEQPGKVWRIGVLEGTPGALNAANLEAFRQGLRELGYVEQQNYAIEYRSADGRPERFPDLAAELVRLQVDLIVTRGTSAVVAAKNATRTIPIVMATSGDALGSGVVSGLARPAGNVTGLSTLNAELVGKRLGLLKEAIPGIARIAVVQNTSSPGVVTQRKLIEAAARFLGFQHQFLDVRKPEDLGRAFETAVKQRADAIVIGLGTLTQTHLGRIVDLSAKHRLPSIYSSRDFVDGGGLMAYGASIPETYRRAATYVDKIFKGAKPGDLPLEQSGVEPVAAGLVASLAKPGANVTGLTFDVDATQLAAKRLEILKQLLPSVSRVAVLWNPSYGPGTLRFKGTEDAGRKLGITIVSVQLAEGGDAQRAFAETRRARAEALTVLSDPAMVARRAEIIELAARHRLPAMYALREWVEGGGLISYATNLSDQWRRAARYVDKLLKGARPSELPIEQPAAFELWINFKAARALGLTIPQSLLQRANEVIQ